MNEIIRQGFLGDVLASIEDVDYRDENYCALFIWNGATVWDSQVESLVAYFSKDEDIEEIIDSLSRKTFDYVLDVPTVQSIVLGVKYRLGTEINGETLVDALHYFLEHDAYI